MTRPLVRPGRLALACGIVGPGAFVTAWVAGGLATPGYTPVEQAISQLAREGAATAAVMTAGFVTFGLLMPVYATALGRALGSPAVRAATTLSGLATLAVAALPLSRAEGRPVDTWHAVAAGTGYVGQALAPLLATRVLTSHRDRQVSDAVGSLAGACLVGSIVFPSLTGLLQRTGLTAVDAWFVVAAVRLLRR